MDKIIHKFHFSLEFFVVDTNSMANMVQSDTMSNKKLVVIPAYEIPDMILNTIID